MSVHEVKKTHSPTEAQYQPLSPSITLLVDKNGIIQDIFKLDTLMIDASSNETSTKRLWTSQEPTDHFEEIVHPKDKLDFKNLFTTEKDEKSALLHLLVSSSGNTIQDSSTSVATYQITVQKSTPPQKFYLLQGTPY